ncbi:hypothetical protein BJ741DRAFT_580286 [Chytriomyces cf. hyalinus JEL632]|nr:hypothetical protein BJ741DRAFT_580286 [Chytriomyces cf. hyalinus JEL632]
MDNIHSGVAWIRTILQFFRNAIFGELHWRESKKITWNAHSQTLDRVLDPNVRHSYDSQTLFLFYCGVLIYSILICRFVKCFKRQLYNGHPDHQCSGIIKCTNQLGFECDNFRRNISRVFRYVVCFFKQAHWYSDNQRCNVSERNWNSGKANNEHAASGRSFMFNDSSDKDQAKAQIPFVETGVVPPQQDTDPSDRTYQKNQPAASKPKSVDPVSDQGSKGNPSPAPAANNLYASSAPELISGGVCVIGMLMGVFAV